MPPKGKKRAQEPEPEPDDDEENDDYEDPDDGEYEEDSKKSKKGKKSKKEEEDDDEEEEEEDTPEDFASTKKTKKQALTVTLTRIGGSLGIAMSGNYVTGITAKGAGEKAGMKAGDIVTEVNGKDPNLSSFGELLPKDKEAPIKLRLTRFIEVA